MFNGNLQGFLIYEKYHNIIIKSCKRGVKKSRLAENELIFVINCLRSNAMGRKPLNANHCI